MSDPTRCRHCGVALRTVGIGPHLADFEIDTGELHVAEQCRSYLAAERDALRQKLSEAAAKLLLLQTAIDLVTRAHEA
jgi:hypothetical protein